jgi:hypothetical protein
MNMRKALVTAIAGCTFALGSGAAMAAVDCSGITSISLWQSAGSCTTGDKTWTFGSSDLLGTVGVAFQQFAMQITGFDTTTAAGSWDIKYSITVTDPNFYISDMFAGADNPDFGSQLTKTVTGDPGGPFVLTDTDGAEGPTAVKHGLHSISLSIDEAFSVIAGEHHLLSVSNTYLQTRVALPLPGTLALFGLGLVALGAVRRTRKSS